MRYYFSRYKLEPSLRRRQWNEFWKSAGELAVLVMWAVALYLVYIALYVSRPEVVR